MADPTATQPTHEASMPETSAPTQFYTAQQQHHHHHQSAQPPHSQPEPLDLLKAEPFRPSQFRPSKPFSVGKLTLASCNSVFAIAALGLSIGILTIALYDMIGVLIAGTMVRNSPPPPTSFSHSVFLFLSLSLSMFFSSLPTKYSTE